jgi:hypothetical protein
MSGFIGVLISIIVTLIVLGVIWWAIQQLLPLIPMGEPFRTIIRVLMTVIMVLVVLWVMLTLLGYAGYHTPFRLGDGGFTAGRAVQSAYLQGLLTNG